MPMFGAWDLVTTDLASGQKAYVNRTTGEVSEDPPEEVLSICEARNRERRKQVYEPTSFRFAPLLRDLAAARHEPEQKEADEAFESVCRCCGDCGFVEGLGSCPLCDGLGSEGWGEGDASSGASSEDGKLPLSHGPPGNCPVESINFLEGDDCAVFLRNLLSPAECCDLIEQAERFGLRSCGYSAKIRVTDRVAVMGEELAGELFERVRPYLSEIEISSRASLPRGLRTDVTKPGIWSPTGLNPCFRVCRYEPGGFFLPHHDEGFDYSHEHLSLKTLMVYLNDGFEGAPTNFYDTRQRHYKEPDPSNLVYELHPERGSCVLFNQRITHDGGRLRSGQKYILRSEVMYRWRRA